MAISQKLSRTKPTLGLRPPGDAQPATGYRDTIRESIESALARYTGLPSDPYLQMMREHATDAGNALEDVRALLWKLQDDFSQRYEALSSMQQVALQYVAQNERPKFFEELQSKVRDELLNSSTVETAEPERLAARCVTTLKTFNDAHQASLDDYQGPRLMSVEGRALSVQDLERQAAREKEIPIDPATAAPTKLLALYKRMLARAEDQKLIELETAAQKYAIFCRAEEPIVMKARLRSICGEGFDADKEKVAAFDILTAIRDRKTNSTPQSLDVTKAVLFDLRGVFQLLVGVHATLMAPQARAARYGYDGNGGEDKNVVGEKNQFEIDANWLKRRFEQREPFKMPGWSKPYSKDSNGNFVRVPPAPAWGK